MKLSGYDESPNAALDRHLGSAKLVYNLRIREIIRRRLQTKGGNIVYFLHVIFPLLSTSFMLSFRPRERRSGNADASPASPFGFESRLEPEVSIVLSRDTSGRFPASARCPGPVAIDPLSRVESYERNRFAIGRLTSFRWFLKATNDITNWEQILF